ncbi:hypothetical protein [Pelosinus sp. UFO1]|uniref:hypothetical protein n=1 Tax=Pelosinus sp. UFO1 TaxID=484770 RepID=UPI0004D14B61|nr:hypothetical protein [Pelosinus sp. UFO1]AIF52242.1 hypothetical protein UFO1_2699 [Pelosinus sp. UFO1]
MDNILPLALIAAMYLIPPLWRHYIKSKKVSKVSVEQVLPPMENDYEESLLIDTTHAHSSQISSNVTDKNELVNIEKELSPWEGKLSESVIQNGVIFAEILQPPRAYRPFKGKFK